MRGRSRPPHRRLICRLQAGRMTVPGLARLVGLRTPVGLPDCRRAGVPIRDRALLCTGRRSRMARSRRYPESHGTSWPTKTLAAGLARTSIRSPPWCGLSWHMETVRPQCTSNGGGAIEYSTTLVRPRRSFLAFHAQAIRTAARQSERNRRDFMARRWSRWCMSATPDWMTGRSAARVLPVGR
jgi:hypothetical protein